MILDALTRLSNSQAPAAGATTVSTNSYDLGDHTPDRQIGDGEPIAVIFTIESKTPSADTYTFQVIQADNDALTTNVRVIAKSPIVTGAQLTAARNQVVVAIPPGFPTQQFIGTSYILGAADAAVVSAHIQPMSMISSLKDYASAIVVE